MDNTKTEMIAGKERLLCYAGAILTAKINHPGNISTTIALIPSSIREASELIKQVYESE